MFEFMIPLVRHVDNHKWKDNSHDSESSDSTDSDDSDDSDSKSSSVTSTASSCISKDRKDELLCAVQRGETRCVREIIRSKGLSHNASWREGYVPLMKAIAAKQILIARILLHAGAKVNIPPSEDSKDVKNTPLHVAIKSGQSVSKSGEQHFLESEILDLIKHMITTYKADVNAENALGETALYVATKFEYYPAMQILIDHKAKLDVFSESGMTPLFLTVCNNDMEGYLILQKAGADLHYTSNQGTLLHVAADYLDDFEFFESLLKAGLNANATNLVGETPLHLVRNLSAARALLEKNVDIDKKDFFGNTPLHTAIINRNTKVALFLIQMKASLNIKNASKQPPLFYAVRSNNVEITKSLLENNVDIYGKFETQSILALARKYCDKEIVRLLINHHQNFYEYIVNAKVSSADLMLKVVSEGLTSFAKHLIELGADVNSRFRTRNFGCRGLHSFLQVAMYTKDYEMAEMLLKNQANVNVLNCRKFTLLHFLFIKNKNENGIWVSRVEDERTKLIKLLINYGIDVNYKSASGNTFVHFAARVGCLELLNEIEEAGLEVDARTTSRITPLHFAVREGHKAMVSRLLELGADSQAVMVGGLTPLHIAVMFERPAILEMLLRTEVDINSCDDYNRTPLHIAVWNGSACLVEILLRFHPNVIAKDHDGRSPISLARDFTDCYVDIDNRLAKILKGLSREYFDLNPERDVVDYVYVSDNGDCSYDKCRCLPLCPKDFAGILEGYQKYTMELESILEMPRNELENEIEILDLTNRKILINEVLKMRKKKISVSTTYYDVLMQSLGELVTRSRKQRALRNLQFNAFENLFPYYGGMIKNRLLKIKEREALVVSGTRAVNTAAGYTLPDSISRQILNYMDHADIKKIVRLVETI